jgi:hypothetical protein
MRCSFEKQKARQGRAGGVVVVVIEGLAPGGAATGLLR